MTGVKGKSGGPRANAGGARPGAGRKPKPPTLITVEAATPVIGGPMDPRPALEQIAQGLLEVSPQQFKALTALLPYVHKKLGEGGKKDEKQAAAEGVAGGRFGLRAVR